MAKTLKNLLLAMLHATLILIALCLVLALMVMNKADAISATFAQNLIRVEPVKDELVALRTEVTDLRTDLQDFANRSDTLSWSARAGLETEVESLNARLDALAGEFSALNDLPFELADHAISRTGEELSNRVMALRNCRRVDATSG